MNVRKGLVVAATLGAGLVAPAASHAQLIPGLPTVPGVPSLPVPGLPTLPGLPTVPGTPSNPGTPSSPNAGAALTQLRAAAAQALAGKPGAAEVDALFAQLIQQSAAVSDPAALLAAGQQALAQIAAGDAQGAAQTLATATGAGAAPGGGTGSGSGSGAGTGTATPAAPTRPAFTPFAARAGVSKLKLAKNRRSAKMKVSCPTAAPACLVALDGKVGARKAFKQKALAIAKGTSRGVRVKLSSGAVKKLRKGGRLTVSAATGGSTLGAATRSVKAKKVKQAKKAKRTKAKRGGKR